MSKAHSSNTMVVALFAGIAGAATALLLAPRSGAETRERLRARSQEMKQTAKSKMRAAKGKVDETREEARGLKDRLTAAAGNTGRKAKQEMEELKDSTNRDQHKQSPVLTSWEEEV